MKRDRNNPAYVNELWRRWERRRDLPFRQFDAAWEALWGPLVEWLAARLDQYAGWLRRAIRLLTH